MGEKPGEFRGKVYRQMITTKANTTKVSRVTVPVIAMKSFMRWIRV